MTLALIMGTLLKAFFALHVWLMLKATTTIEFCEKRQRCWGEPQGKSQRSRCPTTSRARTRTFEQSWGQILFSGFCRFLPPLATVCLSRFAKRSGCARRRVPQPRSRGPRGPPARCSERWTPRPLVLQR
jgi:hypothetical protein